MQSFSEKAKKIIEKHEDLFNIFEELDRTGIYRKPSYKKRVNFTIDEDLFNRFKSFCRKKCIVMSGRIEDYMKKELKS